MNPRFTAYSIPKLIHGSNTRHGQAKGREAVAEFVRSSAIMLMAVVVLAAGVAVFFYG
ncbi:MAG: hypothetical protein JSS54_12110 [Proteobacteria bacterium]|nr:hypothetical protein [Pseudomonadota bacterium]MBS0269710.1 hypothetical protein [Pseudomonadota bacterium]